MRIALIDFQSSFYDRHWLYSLMPVLIAHDARWFNMPTVKTILTFRPHLVLYSGFQCDIPTIKKFDAELRKVHKFKSIAGGAGATFAFSEFDQSTLDAVCLGEGEIAIADYIRSGLRDGRNIKLRGEHIGALAPFIELDRQPFPDRTLAYEQDNILRLSPFKAFMSGRGCPYDCSYCFNHAYNNLFKGCGKIVRKKSVAYLIDEILQAKRCYPLKLVSFQDDTFIIDHEWTKEFCQEYRKKVCLPFVCNIRANLLNDEIAQALKFGGCKCVGWSIESGNEFIRNSVLCRRISIGQIINASALLRMYNIKSRTANIIGVPCETEKEVKETLEVNRALQPDFATANIFVPYQGLKLTEIAQQQGVLGNDIKNVPTTFFDKSILNFSESHKIYLRKTAYLFPILVQIKSKWLEGLLYKMPCGLLRVVYEFVYLWNCKKLYGIKTGLRMTIEMALRYLKGVLR